MTTHIVYVPGLGDGYHRLRSIALAWWKLWGASVTPVKIDWYDGRDMDQKMSLIKGAINTAPKRSCIVLVGESAGATLALHTSVVDKRVDRVITLCGVARPDTPISSRLRRKVPALDQATNTLPEHFDVSVHSVQAAIDNVVRPKYSTVLGAHRHVIWFVGHLATIVLCLTILAPYMVHIAKASKK